MDYIDLLMKAGFAARSLVAFLTEIGDAVPGLKPRIDAKIAELQSTISADAITALIPTLEKELKDIGQGHLNPRNNPSDSI